MTAIQMIDVHLPATDDRVLVPSRFVQPEKDRKLLPAQLRLSLPDQPPPRIRAATVAAALG